MTAAERVRVRCVLEDRGLDSPCHTFTGALATGYGRVLVGSRTDGSRRLAQAHRVVYEDQVGPIPEGMQLDHLCRNRACVNPAHVEVVTNAENSRRGARGRLVTACIHGHQYTPENTRIRPNGRRACRACEHRR